MVHAPDTSIIFSNSRAAALLGLSEDQMHGKVAIDPAWSFVDETGKKLDPDAYPVKQALLSQRSFTEMVMGIRHPNIQLVRF